MNSVHSRHVISPMYREWKTFWSIFWPSGPHLVKWLGQPSSLHCPHGSLGRKSCNWAITLILCSSLFNYNEPTIASDWGYGFLDYDCASGNVASYVLRTWEQGPVHGTNRQEMIVMPFVWVGTRPLTALQCLSYGLRKSYPVIPMSIEDNSAKHFSSCVKSELNMKFQTH